MVPGQSPAALPATEPAAVPEPGPLGASGEAGSIWRASVRTFAENRLAIAGLGIVVFMVLFCYVGPLVYRTNQVTTNLLAGDLPPSLAHPLGTTGAGYDVLGRLMVGGQNSLEMGFAVAIVSTFIGTMYGAVSGYVGGVVDGLMMRIVDALLAIPTLVLLLILVNVFKPTLGLLIVVVSLLSWLGVARLVRGETLSLRVREYVQAVKLVGGNRRRAVLRHIVPNAIGVVVVNASFTVADAILVIATLSFLGLGLPPPAASWGGMLTDGLNYLYDGYWWLVYPVGATLVVTVVAFNFIGDALRDSLDVRLRHR